MDTHKKIHTTLRDLLDAEEPLFSQSLRQLEEASGHKGTDVKLTAEIIEKAHQIMATLGLDPADTNGPELFSALNNKLGEQDAHLAKTIGGTDASDVAQMLPLIAAAVAKADIPRDCWVLKKAVAKEFLRHMPPKGIMKILGYTDVAEMLKKEQIGELYGALRFAETSDWLREFNKKYETLTPSDFETRQIEVIQMPKNRWGDIAAHFIEKKRHNITHLKELGVILMLPMKEAFDYGITIKVMALLLHYHNEIRLYSSYFKLQQVKPHFGKIFVDTLNADPDLGPIMAGQHIHWRVIQRYFGKLKDEYHPETFEPHVQPEDLHWRKAEETMYQIDPELAMWRDLDYVALQFEDGPVTFNMMDVSMSYSNKTHYPERNIYHFRESLWNEIFIRYMGHKTLEQQILEQLDNDMIKPEDLTAEDD
ncbi:MAG TPA: hypothetical protein VLF60_04275 [Candidatus Saccharimonadales bacterium]|nr:hypothetical protein [Candidatus Saccharimonadales bacterium]